MPFKTCTKCGKLVRAVDPKCWNCGSKTFGADTSEERSGGTASSADSAPPPFSSLGEHLASEAAEEVTSKRPLLVALFLLSVTVVALAVAGRAIYRSGGFSRGAVGSVSPAAPPPAQPQPRLPAGNTLDQMVRDVAVGGQPLILSYSVDGVFAVLQINPALWNALGRGEQQQLGDMLARSRAWDDLKLVNARLYVYGTEVGRVKPNMTGGKKFILY